MFELLIKKYKKKKLYYFIHIWRCSKETINYVYEMRTMIILYYIVSFKRKFYIKILKCHLIFMLNKIILNISPQQ